MTCLSNEELEELYHGNIEDEPARNMFTHIAICNHCSDNYYRIAENNMTDHAIDVSGSVMKQIKKSPLSRGKLLAIYTVAAACAFVIMTSGSVDKVILLSHQVQNETVRWSEKINTIKINQYWEDITHGIQN